MVVYLKSNSQLMIVERFFMDDFSDRFCDRLECSLYEGLELKKAIFTYDDIEILGVNISTETNE